MLRKRLQYFAVAAAVGLAILAGQFVPDALRPENPANTQGSGEILVVQANLQEALRPADTADPADLDHFARRLVATTPADPDVLLLTEILGPGARHVAAALSRLTGSEYEAKVAGGKYAWLPDGTVRESAVIVNTTTMTAVGTAGFVRIQDEDQAHVTLQDKRSGSQWQVVAGHVAGDTAPAAQQLADRAMPDATSVIGVDFRDARCPAAGDYQEVGCAGNPFWTHLTQAGYEDAAYVAGNAQTRKLSNFLFARAAVARAFVDTAHAPGGPDLAACKAAYDAGRSAAAGPRCASYYADTPFTWALLEPAAPQQVSVIPGSVTMDRCRLSNRVATVVARVVNNTADGLSVPIAAEAVAPLTVEPVEQTAEIPAGSARDAVLTVTAPRAGTRPGTYAVTVKIGDDVRTVQVTVPEQCFEPAAFATSFHVGNEPEKAVDGDIATMWHSEWQPYTPLPQSITVNLGEVRTVSTLTYQPRFDGNLNGTILDYHVYVSHDGASFTKVAQGTWPADARLKTATFPSTEARYVRLESTRSSGGSYASAAEVAAR